MKSKYKLLTAAAAWVILVNSASFVGVSARASSQDFDRKNFERAIRNGIETNESRGIEISLLNFFYIPYKIFYEIPSRPGRNLAYWVYNK